MFFHSRDNKYLSKRILRRSYWHYKLKDDVTKLAGSRPAQKWLHFATVAQHKKLVNCYVWMHVLLCRYLHEYV